MIKFSKGFAPIMILILFAAVIFGYYFYRQYEFSRMGTNSLTTQTEIPKASLIASKIDLSIYADSTKWVYFNKDFKLNPVRDFRFRYPKTFKLEDFDSGSVALGIDGNTYINIEGSTIGSKTDPFEQRIKDFYKNNNSANGKIPTEFLIIPLTDPNFEVYRITMNGSQTCGGGGYNREMWYCYLGEYKGRGFALAETIEVPEDIVLHLIESIEFK